MCRSGKMPGRRKARQSATATATTSSEEKSAGAVPLRTESSGAAAFAIEDDLFPEYGPAVGYPPVYDWAVHNYNLDLYGKKYDTDRDYDFGQLRHELSDIDKAAVATVDVLAGGETIPDWIAHNAHLHAALVSRGGLVTQDAFAGMIDNDQRRDWNMDRDTWHVPSGYDDALREGGPKREDFVIFFDPNGWRGWRKEAPTTMTGKVMTDLGQDVEPFGIQAEIGRLHRDQGIFHDIFYGMCDYLTLAVLRRMLDVEAATDAADPGEAARDIWDSLKGDHVSARKLDMWMIASAARSHGITTRTAMRAPKKTNVQRKAEHDYEKLFRDQPGDFHEKWWLEHAERLKHGNHGMGDAELRGLMEWHSTEAERKWALEKAQKEKEKKERAGKPKAKGARAAKRTKAGGDGPKAKRARAGQAEASRREPSISHRDLTLIAATELALHRLRGAGKRKGKGKGKGRKARA
ncbi:hypothetical protein WJX74_003023 [Apatococcus lobatus]|uniref:Uncharacterized protein n=1 Tax=Apatococcus lobatus TaxID=904363 RepID=A0AAW1Q2A4_9CHLO